MILDLHCRLQSAMVYVMLSRVQCLSQLFILQGVPFEKVKPFLEAYGEVEKLTFRDVSLHRVITNPDVTQIVSLNVSSLQKHIADLRANQLLCENDMICVQETWLDANDEVGDDYQLPGKVGTFVSVGRGKGVAVLYPPTFTESFTVKKSSHQMAAVSRRGLTVINLYRSQNANTEELILDFLSLMQKFDGQQTIVLCGDFNLCEREDKLHAFMKLLWEKGFKSLLNPPQASHQEGRCLDQAYCRHGEPPSRFICTAKVGTCSFSDHDAIMVSIRNIQ